MGKGRPIPNRLRRYRIIAGYNQKQVAEILGLICRNRVSRWEKGTSMPNLQNLIKLSSLYKTLIEELYHEYIIDTKEELNKLIKSKKT